MYIQHGFRHSACGWLYTGKLCSCTKYILTCSCVHGCRHGYMENTNAGKSNATLAWKSKTLFMKRAFNPKKPLHTRNGSSLHLCVCLHVNAQMVAWRIDANTHIHKVIPTTMNMSAKYICSHAYLKKKYASPLCERWSNSLCSPKLNLVNWLYFFYVFHSNKQYF